MRNILLFTACVVLALPAGVRAQAGSEVQKKVDAVLAEYDKPDSPGCALGVIRDGMLIHSRGYGMANLEHNAPITGTTVFDIGSTSKQFTAAAIHLLAQRGKLSLDDDVRKHIPELPDYGKKITVRHLLHHTSGLRDYLTLWSLAGADFTGVTNENDALRLIVRQKELNFAPGDEHLYSNSGYFLLSVIVRRAGGKSLREFAAENIFGPLQMQSTHFHDDHEMIVPQRATGYARRREGGFAIDMSGFEQTGDGAVFTTIEDLLVWDQNFYAPKIGGPEMVAALQATGALNNGEKLSYASGLVVGTYRGLKTVSHGGAWAGYRAELLRFPDEKFSVACLCNFAQANPSRLARQVAEAYLGQKMAPGAPAPAAGAAAGVALAADELRKWAGLYLNRTSGTLLRITEREGKLWISTMGSPPEELQPLARERFRVANWPPSYELRFEPVATEAAAQIRFLRENRAPETLERVAEYAPTAAEWAGYAGTYSSDELDTTYIVAAERGRLMARVKSAVAAQPRPLEPTYRDAFAGPGGAQVEFTRDAQGHVSGFFVHAGRIRNVKFLRQ